MTNKKRCPICGNEFFIHEYVCITTSNPEKTPILFEYTIKSIIQCNCGHIITVENRYD